MALIKCPECGQEVSDKAAACPRCAYPIAQFASASEVTMGNTSPVGSTSSKKKIVRIKLSVIADSSHKVNIFDENDETLWTGRSGQVAEFPIDDPTKVTIRYGGPMFGPTVSGVIDPEKGLKYNVVYVSRFLGGDLVLQRVDVIDSD